MDTPKFPNYRGVELQFTDGTKIGDVVWAYGQCTVNTYVESRREPRLDADNLYAIDLFIWSIQHHDPSGILEFLWDDYLDSTDRAS